jgi:hypothetical protein
MGKVLRFTGKTDPEVSKGTEELREQANRASRQTTAREAQERRSQFRVIKGGKK